MRDLGRTENTRECGGMVVRRDQQEQYEPSPLQPLAKQGCPQRTPAPLLQRARIPHCSCRITGRAHEVHVFFPST